MPFKLRIGLGKSVSIYDKNEIMKMMKTENLIAVLMTKICIYIQNHCLIHCEESYRGLSETHKLLYHFYRINV